MSRFVHVEYPARHPGVARIERAARAARSTHAGHYLLAALAAVGAPVKRWLEASAAARKQRHEDEKLWQLALSDARVMADLSRAMSAEARDLRNYY